ncbi:MAG: GNAT family N-acetyltransferase [Myxococcota bacterium]
MSGEVPLPLALVEGFAEVWSRLAGGTWERCETSVGHLVIWTSPDGRREALPDRMYGLVTSHLGELDPLTLPAGLSVNLPPGVSAEGAVLHAVGHQLTASDRESAWSSLRRVGRQGVLKARRKGCRVRAVEAEDYLALASLKAERFGGEGPHPELVRTLREIFGEEAVAITGAVVDEEVAAAVLSLHVEGYGMLVDGASDRAHWDKNPNNLAVWSAVGALVDAGCGRIDYGFSEPGAGDLRFKDHMGGREVALYRVGG